MLRLEDDVLSARVRGAVGELLVGAEQLRGLAQALDGFGGLPGNADADEIKQVAISVRATAVQALLTATTAVGLSERLSTVAAVIERAQPEDTDGENNDECSAARASKGKDGTAPEIARQVPAHSRGPGSAPHRRGALPAQWRRPPRRQARAKQELNLASVKAVHTGAVCAVQGTDSALRLNVHVHVLALDGVYVREAERGVLRFEALDPPSPAIVLDVARRTAERIDKLLRTSGRRLEPEGDEPVPELVRDEPGLAACYAAAAQGVSVSGEQAGQPVLRLMFGQSSPLRLEPNAAVPIAEHRGINVHA